MIKRKERRENNDNDNNNNNSHNKNKNKNNNEDDEEEINENNETESKKQNKKKLNNDKKKQKNSNSSSSSTTTTTITTTSSLNNLPPRPVYTNKQRILVIASRGINARYRHLLEDLKRLLPHHKKDNKLDAKNNLQSINEIAEINSCNQVLYLECRKRQDLYLHLAHTPSGPSVKFHVVNVHTMDELKLTGNAMLGSRPLLNFDKGFEKSAHLLLIKSLLSDAFGTPNGHPKSKPFVDRIMSFYVIKNKIWVRNYQILDRSERRDGKDSHLVEIGPRMVLIPIRIFNGSFGGATLYQNASFISPNEERSDNKKRKSHTYVERIENKKQRNERQLENVLPPDELSNINVFK